MRVEWTNEVLIVTGAIVLVFLISAFLVRRVKTRTSWRLLLLLVGFIGIWWMTVDVGYFSTNSKSSITLSSAGKQSISAFLSSADAESVDRVVLSGNHFGLEEMKLLQNYKLEHVPDSIPVGFVSIDVPEISENEEWTLHGNINLSGKQVVGLILPNGAKTDVLTDSEGRFSIASKAPTKGLYEYKLFLIQGELDTLVERLPIQVREERKLNMLLIAETPQFELNYFKNYWKNLGYGLVQKVRISQSNFSTSYLNMPKINFSKLTEKVVSRFDIIMLDMRTWNGLAAGERNIILRQMEDRALAVVLRINEVSISLKSLPRITVGQFIVGESDETLISTAQLSHGESWSSVNGGAVYERGYGKLLVVGKMDTYKWILNDKKQQYQRHWAKLLSELYLRTQDGIAIEIPFLATEGKRTIAKISKLPENASLFLNDDKNVALMRIPFIEEYATTQFDAGKGWNKVGTEAGNECWFYIHNSASWEAMRQQQVVDLGQYLTSSKQLQKASEYETFVQFPWWLGFSLMLLGFGMLWVDEKVYS